MNKKSLWKEFSLIGLLLLMVLGSGCGGPPSEDERVLDMSKRYAQKYFEADDYSDIGELYDMLSDDEKPLLFDNWAVKKLNEKRQLSAQDIRLELIKAENPRVTEVNATADIRYKRHSKGFVQTKTQTIALVKEKGNWKIAEDVSFTD